MVRKRKRYLRKSTEAADRQAKSHEEQNAECDRKWGPLPDPADLYTDSRSGTTFDRPGFQKLLQDCLADPQPPDNPGRIEIYDPSRFGRPLANGQPDTRAYRRMLWRLEEAGWRVEFVTLERSDDALADELQILFHAYNASTFSVDLSRKVRLGKKAHAEEGYWIHGLAPLGTVRVVEGTIRVLGPNEQPRPWERPIYTNRSDLPPGHYEVGRVLADGEPAGHGDKVILAGSEVLKHWPRVAQRYLDGVSLQKLGQELFAAGVRGRYGGVLDHTATRNFLRNPALVGRIHYRYRDHDGQTHETVIPAKWAPLVDVNLWNAVQLELAKRGQSQYSRRKSHEDYPLLPICAHCHSPYWGSSRRDGAGGYVRVLRHAPVDERKHPDRYQLYREHGCSRYEIDADELEKAARDVIAGQRGSPEFGANLRRMLDDNGAYHQALQRRAQELKRDVARAERLVSAAIQSLNEARAEGKDGNDLALFKEAVEQAQAQLRLHRQNLAAAEREQTNAAHAWSAMQEVLDETRNIAAGWDKLTIKERSLLFRHWVAAVFIAVEKIPGRKRGHRKHAVFYLAGTPRLSGEVVDASANAASISSITTWSVSVDSALVNATTADADPMRPRAHAECDRTSGSGSDSPDFSDGTAASSPQFPNATATFRRKPALPARRRADPREKASQAASSMDMRSTSEGAAVPGCHASDGSRSTPGGGSPGPLGLNASSEVGLENFRLYGQTSWQISQPNTRVPISGRSSRGIGPRSSIVR